MRGLSILPISKIILKMHIWLDFYVVLDFKKVNKTKKITLQDFKFSQRWRSKRRNFPKNWIFQNIIIIIIIIIITLVNVILY